MGLGSLSSLTFFNDMKCLFSALIKSGNEPIAKDDRYFNFRRFVKLEQPKASYVLFKI